MDRIISDSESHAISLLRIFAMCAIVVCHFLQGYDSNYCYLFNIGVQIFLAISGYLYGCKTIRYWKSWFLSRVEKLYIPYILFFLVCIPFYCLFASNKIDATKMLIHVADLGLGHLWFMSAIAVCYLLTPLLQYLRKYTFVLLLILSVSILEFFFIRFAEWQFSWLFVYTLGYMYASANKWGRNIIISFAGFLFLCSLMNISWEDVLCNGVWNQWFHVTGGILAVALITFLAKYLHFSKGEQIWKVMDKYSYEVYITHHIFILGPFSMLFFSASSCVNILVILVLTVLTAIVLHRVSSQVKRYLYVI